MGLPDAMGLPPANDEAVMAASEFQQTAREELVEAANNIVEKMSGCDWYDLTIRNCHLATGADGTCGQMSLDLMVRGKRMTVTVRSKGSASLAEQLERSARLKWPAERDPVTRQVKGGRPEGMAKLRAAVRAAKAVWALADAVTRFPGVAEPRTLMALIDGLRLACRKDAARAARSARLFLGRLGKAAGLGGARGALRMYKGLVLTEKGAAALARTDASTLLQARKVLLKAREKIREEAEKTGLLLPPGSALDLGLALPGPLDAGPVPALPPLPDAGGLDEEDVL